MCTAVKCEIPRVLGSVERVAEGCDGAPMFFCVLFRTLLLAEVGRVLSPPSSLPTMSLARVLYSKAIGLTAP